MTAVSSHAPVRGHLHDLSELGIALAVSSHAPVRGHLCGVAHPLHAVLVSSHAPVRGHHGLDIFEIKGELFQVMPP